MFLFDVVKPSQLTQICKQVMLKNYPNILQGQKELYLNLLIDVRICAIDNELFYQTLLSKIHISKENITHMIELLQDISVIAIKNNIQIFT